MIQIALQMVRVNLLKLIRDRRALFFMIVMPIVLTSILSFALTSVFGGKGVPPVTVGIYNEDKGPLGAEVRAMIAESSPSIQVVNPANAEQGKEQLDTGFTDVFVDIPEDFTSQISSDTPTRVSVTSTLSTENKREIVESIINSYGRQTGIQTYAGSQLGTNSAQVNPVRFAVEAPGLRPITSGSYYAVGMMVMFLLMTAFNYAVIMVDERNSDRYRRFLASPASRQALCFGYWMSSSVILLLQGVALLLCARYILGIELGPWYQMLLLTLSYSVALAGVTVLFGTFVRSRKVMDGFNGVGVQVAAALGGSIVPLYAFPQTLRAAGHILPNGLALNGLLNSISGISMSGLFVPVVTLLTIGIGLGLVSGTRYGRTE